MPFNSGNKTISFNSSILLSYVLPVVFIILVVFSYTIITFNKYLPIQEGWFQFYHTLMRDGKFPYRDFFVPIQPVFILLTHLITTLFGTSFMVLRWYGLIERVILIVLVFIYLRKHFDGNRVFFLTLVGFFLYSSFNANLPYSYYQTTLLFGFIGIYFICNGVIFKSKILLNLYFGGFWTTVTFFTKQSSGLMLLLISIFVVTIQSLRVETKFELMKRLSAYFFGTLTVAAPILIWLYTNSALSNYYDQVYKSTTSKGSPSAILFGFIPRLFTHVNSGTLLIVSVYIILSIYIGHILSKIEHYDINSSPFKGALLFFMFQLAFIYPLITNKIITRIIFVNYNFVNVIVVVTFIGIFISVAISFCKWLKNSDDEKNNFVLLTGLFCFGWMYGHGMSGVLEVHSLLPAFPFLMLQIFRHPHTCLPHTFGRRNAPSNVPKRLKILERILEDQGLIIYNTMKMLGLVILLALIVIIASTRYYSPYWWWGWGEPSIKTATLSSSIPALHGIKLSPETYAFYSEAYEKIISNTGPHDDVFFFPHISALNVMTNRTHTNFAPVTYFDVCPDKYAEMTAHYLEKSPPKMIIYMDFPEEVWKLHETIFRGGKLSGQRKIKNVIMNFKRLKRYEVIYSSKIPYNDPVEILIRVK